jgi:hypothetical protein
MNLHDFEVWRNETILRGTTWGRIATVDVCLNSHKELIMWISIFFRLPLLDVFEQYLQFGTVEVPLYPNSFSLGTEYMYLFTNQNDTPKVRIPLNITGGVKQYSTDQTLVIQHVQAYFVGERT